MLANEGMLVADVAFGFIRLPRWLAHSIVRLSLCLVLYLLPPSPRRVTFKKLTAGVATCHFALPQELSPSRTACVFSPL